MTESNLRTGVRIQTAAENSNTIFAQNSQNETEKHSSSIADFKQEPSR